MADRVTPALLGVGLLDLLDLVASERLDAARFILGAVAGRCCVGNFGRDHRFLGDPQGDRVRFRGRVAGMIAPAYGPDVS